MECSTRFPDPVELIRADVERLGWRLVLRFDRSTERATWVAEISGGAELPVRATGETAEDAARAALEAARAKEET